jgi:hypothetical protein
MFGRLPRPYSTVCLRCNNRQQNARNLRMQTIPLLYNVFHRLQAAFHGEIGAFLLSEDRC